MSKKKYVKKDVLLRRKTRLSKQLIKLKLKLVVQHRRLSNADKRFTVLKDKVHKVSEAIASINGLLAFDGWEGNKLEVV